MIRAYAVLFAAVTFRLWLPALVPLFGDVRPAYAASAWMSWTINLVWAEWFVRRPGPLRSSPARA